MRQKLQARAFEQVAPFLQAGEQPVTASRATVGSFSSGRLGAVVSQAVLLEGAGAVGVALTASRRQYIVVTSHRLIFLPQTFLGGPGKKIIGQVARTNAHLVEAKMGIVSLLRIAFGTSGDGVALTFPRVDKKNAEALAAALQQVHAI
ncbi:hypothetical protein Cme02nite_48770 [Catellatospora methionotrophica]|uniref:Uncharacterized protein n=1 Tax=Catellatospora methionotrophica TaxID=121620 RepID=A0A8J3LPK0_9ACTN|nr:hypothetical protein [Catellatospora methionotrophica]GIG16545.1 hypothetical protein Cme02nite_48770 [Catellatospora methionotrophica]